MYFCSKFNGRMGGRQAACAYNVIMNKQMKIGIIVAMDKEFVQLRTLMDNAQIERVSGKDFALGTIGGRSVVMQQCGIGKVNSAVGAVEMIEHFHPDVVVSSGVAGGADPSLDVTDVVVATECCYHDVWCGSECAYGQVMGMPPVFKTSQELVSKALTIDCGTRIHAGLTVSGDWFVDSREKMQTILNHFPQAEAVDMESCSIAQVCHIYNVPFISFRIISDVPLKDHKAAQYFDFWNRMAEGSFNVTKSFLEII